MGIGQWAVVSSSTPTTPADVNRRGMSGDFRESAPALRTTWSNMLMMMLVVMLMMMLDMLMVLLMPIAHGNISLKILAPQCFCVMNFVKYFFQYIQEKNSLEVNLGKF